MHMRKSSHACEKERERERQWLDFSSFEGNDEDENDTQQGLLRPPSCLIYSLAVVRATRSNPFISIGLSRVSKGPMM